MTVTPTTTNPDWHLTLSDGASTLNFLLCDAAGNVDKRAFRRFPIKQTALKTFIGDSKSSDLEPPYFSIVQDDWSGGRGQIRFEDNKMRYFDSEGVDTTNIGAVLLGPKINWANGYTDVNELLSP